LDILTANCSAKELRHSTKVSQSMNNVYKLSHREPNK